MRLYYNIIINSFWCLGVSVKVLLVDLENDQVMPPVTVRGEQDWTVAELKKFLKSVSHM